MRNTSVRERGLVVSRPKGTHAAWRAQCQTPTVLGIPIRGPFSKEVCTRLTSCLELRIALLQETFNDAMPDKQKAKICGDAVYKEAQAIYELMTNEEEMMMFMGLVHVEAKVIQLLR